MKMRPLRRLWLVSETVLSDLGLLDLLLFTKYYIPWLAVGTRFWHLRHP